MILSGEASGCQIAEGGAAIAAVESPVGSVELSFGDGSILVEQDAGRAEGIAEDVEEAVVAGVATPSQSDGWVACRPKM